MHADNTAVKEEPWKELATQAGGRGEGAEQSSGDHKELPLQRAQAVEDFFRNPQRIRDEMERIRSRPSGRPITATDLACPKVREHKGTISSVGKGGIAGDDEAMANGERSHRDTRGSSADQVAAGTVANMQERLESEADERLQAMQREEQRKESERREQRHRDFWVDGVVGGEPTQMAYLVAQALAHVTAHFHPDPDNPPTVKGFIAEIETVDNIPVHARARKLADIQKAYLKAMTKRLIRQGKMEESTGEYSSGLVLMPYHDRIKIFMDKWGNEATTEMWKEEHEAEVGTFYRCTCDYRALNIKSKSDAFPLPRIDDLLDQIPRGTCHFSASDVQDAFWTVKLAEWCREKTAIRTHDRHLQWTVLPQGWNGAANYWARVVAKVFEGILQEESLVYRDDVMVHSRWFGRHYQTLGRVYMCLRDRALTFKLAKTHLNMPSATFLGHHMDATGRYPCVEKVKAIMEKAYPKEDVTAVRSFIGMTLYSEFYTRICSVGSATACVDEERSECTGLMERGAHGGSGRVKGGLM